MTNCFQFLIFVFYPLLWAQEYQVSGVLITTGNQPQEGVKVQLFESDEVVFSDKNGFFSLPLPATFLKGVLLLETSEKVQFKIPIERSNQNHIDLGEWKLNSTLPPIQEESDADWEALIEEDSGLDRAQIGSVLQSQRDLFLNTAAFQFSPTFFRLKGLDPTYQEVRINGIALNSFFKGTPQWSQWGGLNDFTNRAQHLYIGATFSHQGIGGLLSTTEIALQPSTFRSGAKLSQAFSNSSYRWRTQFSYIKTPSAKKLGFGILVSHREGKQGYYEGTRYRASSLSLLAERYWNTNQQTWITFIYTPNKRGKSAPFTKEVYAIKGGRYNPYWGLQEGKIRNSRVSKTNTPMVFINHKWKFSNDHFIQLNSGWIWGSFGNSRLGYTGREWNSGALQGGGSNPDPVYYQYLPSYALRDKDTPLYAEAYHLRKELETNGQLDWNALYTANQTTSGYGIYSLIEDVQKINQKHLTVEHTYRSSNHFEFLTQLSLSKETSTFFATPIDLLGAKFIWDYNPYAIGSIKIQNDLQHPDKKIEKGDPFQYHYGLSTFDAKFSSGTAYTFPGGSVFGMLSIGNRTYTREGFFKKGTYPDHSLGWGTGQKYSFISAKAGVTYAITGRHHVSLKGNFHQQPPAFKNVFVNPRENEFVLPGSGIERNNQIILSYLGQTPTLSVQLNGYAIRRNNIQEINYYFAQGIRGDEAHFIQEITQGVAFSHLGLEGSIEWEITPGLTLAGVAAVGQFKYANNPLVYIGTDKIDPNTISQLEIGIQPMGESLVKNYALSGGPQSAYSLSLHYEDPNYWRISLFGNTFTRAFVDPNPLLRTANFYSDTDGLPFANYNEDQAQSLLTQYRFPTYFLLNANGGKSWKLGTHYFGFFLNLQNGLNTSYITGGFEQGRNSNFQNLLEDQQRETPLFGPKYWWGRGTTFFISTYYRF